MTYVKDYQDCRPCKSDSEFAKCKPKHPKPKNILLECGEGTGSRTFTSSNDAPFQIAHVTVDTTCLNKSKVLIKFSSLVRVERLEFNGEITARLQYELLRACEDGTTISIGTWVFEKVDISIFDFNRAAEESFNFIFCECQTCLRCCDYLVKVTPIEITNATTTVSNGRMAALTQSLKDFSKDESKRCESKGECTESKLKLSKSKEVILECGTGDGSVVFITENEPPVRIANVTIDTSRLCNPKVLIEFSTIVGYSKLLDASSTVRFQFELFRICDNGDPISRGVWNYEVGIIGGSIQSIQGFGFTFCECADFLGCCEYFVTVTPIEVPIIVFDNSMISNSRMTALAKSSKIPVRRCDKINFRVNTLKSKEILLECGQGNGSRTFTSSGESAFQLAEITVDPRGLCKPLVNIEFSSIVSYVKTGVAIGVGLNALLRYELFRVCDDGSAESQGVWVLAKLSQDTTKNTESFDFTFCQSIPCKSSFCTYFVKVTPIEIDDGQVTVSNGRMAALVQEG